MCYPFVVAKVRTFPQSTKQKTALCSHTTRFIDINHLVFQNGVLQYYIARSLTHCSRLPTHWGSRPSRAANPKFANRPFFLSKNLENNNLRCIFAENNYIMNTKDDIIHAEMVLLKKQASQQKQAIMDMDPDKLPVC